MSAIPAPAPTPLSASSATLSQLADTVGHARTLEELVRPLLEVLEALTGMESTYFTLVDEAAGRQTVLFARNTQALDIPESLSVPWDDTLCRRALDEGRAYTENVPAHWGDSAAARELGIQSYASTPVRMEDGRLYGTLCAASARSLPISEEARHALRLFSGLISQQLERERLVQELQAAITALSTSLMIDPVTGLPNRRALVQELTRRTAHAHRAQETVLVAFLDLDGFKAINDRHGHDTGDQFLAAIGCALSLGLRADDFIARLGGDEFVAVASVSSHDLPHALDAFRDRLTACTRGRFELDRVTLDYDGASIGVVAASDADADNEALIARADAAMYEAKRERRAS
ncbi:GGDEF domain-containing protein [Aerolutibacter daejeonensis]|uniref:GGDEF domain-containing protein n=1 Tax=Aerolutibacter daejeonensis TaxID=346181 RepID=UPI00069240BD|nr:sensor domain-containing diguanylate cyclase [Lysobacter daejeonensis]